MKASTLPNLNRETTSFSNFFTLFQDPDHHDDTTLEKRPKLYHREETEASETSPFKDIVSPLVSFNEMNENHHPMGGSFYEWDQMDQTLPRWPPSPNRSDTNVSVGSKSVKPPGFPRRRISPCFQNEQINFRLDMRRT
ncbi:hypothetical protein Vadar_029045 [Vaccinium darrowii]|uniref:Uncharacterized protein n=1 Tax=Vaccinium darrowii TaxID=229202 RepID=A0ACB7YGX7_9ERIC|nr:hypothetical protein Vadar_029045 [Vaccinium darrowii]